MDKTIALLVVGASVILFIFLFWPTVKKLLLNSLVGILLLMLVNLVFGLSIDLSNIYIIAAVTLFGLPGVGTILLLYFGEVI